MISQRPVAHQQKVMTDVTTRSRTRQPDARLALRAMNTDISMLMVNSVHTDALQQAQQMFIDVEAACTRFNPTSPLMLANQAGGDWCTVPRVCFEAIQEAARAHLQTAGLFDPRILNSLIALGYDRTLDFDSGPLHLSVRTDDGQGETGPGHGPSDLPQLVPLTAQPSEPWQPEFDEFEGAVRVGTRPIDLGGIGKGLAVRWAGEILAKGAESFMIEAGGDCLLSGSGPDGDGWKVGVENPIGRGPRQVGEPPIAVLSLTDQACATSSLRKRHWTMLTSDGAGPAHHLIDPRTGFSATGGLRAVTVVLDDPAWAEVWSKALLVAGAKDIAALSRQHGIAALWVDDEGAIEVSPALRDRVIWRVDEC